MHSVFNDLQCNKPIWFAVLWIVIIGVVSFETLWSCLPCLQHEVQCSWEVFFISFKICCSSFQLLLSLVRSGARKKSLHFPISSPDRVRTRCSWQAMRTEAATLCLSTNLYWGRAPSKSAPEILLGRLRMFQFRCKGSKTGMVICLLLHAPPSPPSNVILALLYTFSGVM